MNPFAVDYTDRAAVIEFARAMAKKTRFPQYVVKNPNRDNFNITMNLAWAKADGSEVVWSSVGNN